jgi:hypothetical protein
MKTPILRTDGFYCSGPVEWEDWHAGVHMREMHYEFWRFFPNGTWVRCTRYESNFAFWEFTETLAPDTIEQGRRFGTGLTESGLELFTAGTYLVDGNIITTRFEWRIPLHPTGEQVFHSEMRWTIHGDLLRSCDPEGNTQLRFVRCSRPKNRS